MRRQNLATTFNNYNNYTHIGSLKKCDTYIGMMSKMWSRQLHCVSITFLDQTYSCKYITERKPKPEQTKNQTKLLRIQLQDSLGVNWV